MAQLRFDDERGVYVGQCLLVAQRAVLDRIHHIITESIFRGIDPAAAAEEAWQFALEETHWSERDPDVVVRCSSHRTSSSRHTYPIQPHRTTK